MSNLFLKMYTYIQNKKLCKFYMMIINIVLNIIPLVYKIVRKFLIALLKHVI